MAFPAHCYLTFNGSWTSFGMTGETWQFGIRLKGAGGTLDGYCSDCQTWLNDRTTALKAWFSAAGTMLSSSARLDLIKLNNIQADGTYADPVTHQVAITGCAGNVASAIPAQTTLAWTWTTAAARGQASLGRSYPPFAVSAPIGSGALVATADRDTFMNGGKALLTALVAVTGAGTLQPHVVSRGKALTWDDHHRPTSWGPGAMRPITGVRVDTRLDTQRRRIAQITGGRNSVSFP